MKIDNKALLNSMAEKYRLAERLVFAKLKPWQQEAITEDRKTGNNSGLLHQFCQDVIKTAESMALAAPNAIPPKPKKKVVHMSGPVQWPTDTTSSLNQIDPQRHDKNGANGDEQSEDLF